MSALDANQIRSSKGVKRKRDDDNNILTAFQSLLTQVSGHEDSNDEDDNRNEEDEDDNGDTAVSWIDRWVDKPIGERSRKNSERRPGWGKAEMMEAAGITEDQYNRYMVSFILVVELTDRFLPEICASVV